MAPIANIIRRGLATPSNVDAEDVREQIIGVAPLVVLELPRLAGCEDGYHTIPVLGLELFGALDQDESHRSYGVDVLYHVGCVDHG